MCHWYHGSIHNSACSIDPSKRAELVSCQDSWEGGCQVTEKTQNLFGSSNQRPSCRKIGKTSLQVYINALQMPSDLEAVSSTGWTEVHWRDGKQGCSRSYACAADSIDSAESLWVLLYIAMQKIGCLRLWEMLWKQWERRLGMAWMCFHIFRPFPDPCHKHSPRHWLNNNTTSSCHTMIIYWVVPSPWVCRHDLTAPRGRREPLAAALPPILMPGTPPSRQTSSHEVKRPKSFSSHLDQDLRAGLVITRLVCSSYQYFEA